MRRLWVLALVLVAGCSGFNSKWKRAGQEARPAEGMIGRWEGSWKSEKNGHHGKLRCIATPSTNGMVSAQFHARFWKIFSYGYTVPLQVRQTAGVETFEGEANLGKMAGGVYHYSGVVSATNWQSTYRSTGDHGFFHMNRVP